MSAGGRSAGARRGGAACLLALMASPAFLPRASFAADPPPAPGPRAGAPSDERDDAQDEPAPPPVSRRLWPPPDPPRRRPPTAPPPPDPFDGDAAPSAPANPRPSPAPPDASPAAPNPAPPNAVSPNPGPPYGVPPYGGPPHAVGPYGVPPYGAPPPPNPSFQAPPGVFVELRTDNPNARIEHVLPGGGRAPVCGPPCRLILDRSLAYIIQGDQIPPTSPFLLPNDTNQVTLDVQAGSQTQRYLGVGLMVVGGAVAVVGLSRATTTTTTINDQGQTTINRDSLVALGLGIAAAVIGIVVYKKAGTSVTSSTGATFTERPAPARGAPRLALTPHGLTF